jgi:hypothetical protein
MNTVTIAVAAKMRVAAIESLRTHSDPANSVTARGAATEASAESDEQPGHCHDRERAHRPKERGAFPQHKTDSGAADKA